LGGSAARPTDTTPKHENAMAESIAKPSFDRMFKSLL
jgi:hypothetical protein